MLTLIIADVTVCDAGGGTVDLITYIVKQSQPTIVFEELVGPSGGLCGRFPTDYWLEVDYSGSSYLDTRFEKLLRLTFGIYAESLFGRHNNQTRAQKAYLLHFTRAFSAFKQTFGHVPAQKDFLCTADTTGREVQFGNVNMSDGVVKIDSARIRDEIFIPVIEQIQTLLNEQLNRAAIVGHSTVDFIYLVGGFGNSPFLYDALDEMFSGQGTRVVSVPKSQLTISVIC